MRPSELYRPYRLLRRLAALLSSVALATGLCAAQQVSSAQAAKDRTSRFLGPRRTSAQGSAQALQDARAQHLAMQQAQVRNQTVNLSAAWSAVGPAQVATSLYGSVTGRVTAIAVDPADASGNTVYIGTTGGGVWKSANAAQTTASVAFSPLTDTLPVFSPGAGSSVISSLSVGSVAIANGVLLAGTGDPNDATDSYYGAGILRSADGGTTWTLVQRTTDGVAGNHSLMGLAVASLAFSTATPSLAVAAISHAAEGDLVDAPATSNLALGLAYSTDAGLTWQLATVMDGSQPVQTSSGGGSSATAVVWNPVRQRFYAAIQYHGFYESVDGANWTRLAHQPGSALTAAACPAATFTTCPIFRGVLAVQPQSGDLFAWSVDSANDDQGLYQDVCAASGTSCASATVLFGKQLSSAAMEQGGGSTVVPQGDYDLALAAEPSGTDTLVFAGAVDLYRCSLAAGCAFRNTTNAQNGCTHPAGVAPAQHAIAAASASLLYLGNDGGLYRSTDGVNEQAAACSSDDAMHFQNLNPALGSLAEVVSFAEDPLSPNALLVGLGALGTAGTGSATGSWAQLATGEGGTVAIDPANPLGWYLSTGAGSISRAAAKGRRVRLRISRESSARRRSATIFRPSTRPGC